MTDTKSNSDGICMLAFAGIVILLVLGGYILKSYFEAKTFNELTGRNVSTWQALFVQLRIDDD
jgi:hypothetical protein